MSSPQREPVRVWVDDEVQVEAAEDEGAEGGAGKDDETTGRTGAVEGADNVVGAAERPGAENVVRTVEGAGAEGSAEEDVTTVGITEAEVDPLEGEEYEGLTFHLLTICVGFKDGSSG